MAKGLLGKKIGMTQIFNEEGKAIPVTVIEAGPCPVVQIKNTEIDGYDSLQISFGSVKDKKVTQAVKGHYTKANVKPAKYLREIEVNSETEWQVGQDVTVEIFNEGEIVDVIGVSKGKGFTGVIKRHNFNRGPMAHGSMYHRRTGSLGATDPNRVFKGRRLPGRHGGARVTQQGLTVVKVDKDRNLLLVKGAVPGIRGSLVMIQKTKLSGK